MTQDPADLARMAEDMTPAEWADDATQTARMLAWVVIGSGVFWIAVAVALVGKLWGVW